MTLFRKFSGFATCECFCYDSDRIIGSRKEENCDIRLACNCGVHYDCMIKYVQFKIGDRLSMSLKGIECPYGRACNKFLNSSNSNNIHYLSQMDLHALVDYGELHPELIDELTCGVLTHQKVDDLTTWIIAEESKDVSCLPIQLHPQKVDEEDPYILASTKACPTCTIRTSHYHGHSCHHISPGKAPKRGGCPNCHVNYCYKCLKTETENKELRGNPSNCECGYWSNFCAPFNTMNDLKYLKLHPVPYDKRCGCVICPDCREGKPCEQCPGNCVVCLGILRSGPLDLTANWKPKKTLATWNCLEYLMYSLFESCRLGDHKELQSVLNKAEGGLDININVKIGEDSITPLHYACASKSIECIEILLNIPTIDMNVLEKHSLLPIHVACWKGILEIVVYLSERDAIHANYWGLTTLHLACEHGHLSIVEYLIKTKQVDINCKTAAGRGESPLHYACRNGHLTIVQALLENNADINIQNAQLFTPLRRACENNHFEVIRYLISKDAIIDNRLLNYLIITKNDNKILEYLSIHEYCMQGQLENVIRFISNYSELLYARDENGKTVLHISGESRSSEIIEYLCTEYIDINITDNFGNTALHYACQNGYLNIVQYLLKYNANFDARNKQNQSPLHIAHHNNHLKIIKCLIKSQYSTEIEAYEMNSYKQIIKQPIVKKYHNLISKKKFFYKSFHNKTELTIIPEIEELFNDI